MFCALSLPERTLLVSIRLTPLAAALAAFTLAGASADASDTFNFTLIQAQSTATYNVSASAPFAGTMLGDSTATPPTRTKVGSIRIFPPGVNCGTFTATTNEPINISGSIAATGTNSNIHPTGTYTLTIDTTANTASVQGLSLNLLGGATASIAGGLNNFAYQTMCTVDPVCSLPFLIPVSLTLGNVTITSLSAAQDPGSAAGTLQAEATPNTYTFTIPVSTTITGAASFNGSPLPIDPQVTPIIFTGTITVNGSSATVVSDLTINLNPPAGTTPVDLPPTPITTPAGSALCAGLNLILDLTLSSTQFTVGSTATLNASGTRVACPCDWNHTGGITVQDIFDFLNSYFAGSGDFNGADGTTVQDIFDFLMCYFSPPAAC